MTATFPGTGGGGGTPTVPLDTPPGGVFGSTFTWPLAGRKDAKLGGTLTTDLTLTITGLSQGALFDMTFAQNGTGGHQVTLIAAGDTKVVDINLDPGTSTRVECISPDGTNLDVETGAAPSGTTYVPFAAKTTDYEVLPSDHNTCLSFDSASECDAIINADAGHAPGFTVQIACDGPGGVRLAPGPGVDLRPASFRYIPQDCTLFLVRQPTANLWRILLGPSDSGIPTVTSLPSSPTDGQEVYFVADATNGVEWHLKYRAAATGSYKWECLGGAPLTTLVATQQTTSAESATDLGTVGPSITLPLAGDYLVGVQADMKASVAGLYVTLAFDGETAWEPFMHAAADNQEATVAAEARHNGLTAAAHKLQYRVVGTGTGTWSGRRLSLMPIRVG
jgi:hypothetical protein